MLDTLPSLPNVHLKTFLGSLTPLCSSHPTLFAPHLPALLSFLRALIMPTADSGPTPTVAKPFPATSTSFAFPPGQTVQQSDDGDAEAAEDEEKQQVRRAALELMVTLSEAKPSMVKRVEGWTPAIVRACLEGMGELPEDGLDAWLEADVCLVVVLVVRWIDPCLDSLPKSLKTRVIHRSMSSRWIALRVPSEEKRSSHLLSSIFHPCSQVMIGACATQV